MIPAKELIHLLHKNTQGIGITIPKDSALSRPDGRPDGESAAEKERRGRESGRMSPIVRDHVNARVWSQADPWIVSETQALEFRSNRATSCSDE